MGHGHDHDHDPPARTWDDPGRGLLARWIERARRLVGRRTPGREGLRELPVALRRGEVAQRYLAAERDADHRRAGAAAAAAMEQAMSTHAWWPADLWGHRALWHFERAELTLQATRQARRIGDLRSAAGDPSSARRYYAEAIDEARDIGAEHEQGLAALGLGRALLDLGEVKAGRRMGAAAEALLVQAGASAVELEAARGLRGSEVAVGERTEVIE